MKPDRALRWVGSVISSAAYRFYWDDCFSRAAALAYTTLFALVPVLALSLSMFGIFGLSGSDLDYTLKKILGQVFPIAENEQLRAFQTQIYTSLELFSLNVRALNTLSIGALVFTSIALLNTIESALNVIWRTTSNLGIFAKVTSFWAVLTLGPLMIAVSIFLTTKVEAYGIATEHGAIYAFFFSYFIPTFVTTLGLTLLFYKLPAARVGVGDALLGAIVAAILFEFIKRGFAYYVMASTTYSAIYGVVASIPLFLFWLYVTWVVVLFGAEVSYQSSTIYILHGLRRYATELGEVGALIGLRILLSIGRNFLRGLPPPSEGEVTIEAGSDPVLVRTCLNALTESNILTAADEKTHSRTLVMSPDRITVGAVLETFRSSEYRKRIERGLEREERNALLSLIQKAGALSALPAEQAKNAAGERITSARKDIADWTLSDLLTLEQPPSEEDEAAEKKLTDEELDR